MLNVDPNATKLSDSKYAVHRKELLSLVKQLRAIGAQTDLDLPRIAVIGNQSAGKSSVVEAISGITVPRDAGTCTRCPMECRMSSSENPWSCRISIRWEYDENNNQMKDVTEVPFGEVITNKDEVEIALRCAQAAVLHPATPATQFQGLKGEELERFKGKSLPFSRNVVCVDLEGPDLTDLSFIDLPGIIQNADAGIVNLVEDLVISHIKGNTIILVALPMTDDIENQKALRLARQEDADGRRTIGVLTKPDMLGSGSTKARELWMDVIEGRRHRLTHGYYCTRQPDDADRAKGVTSVQARTAEQNFFRTSTPWSTSSQSHRFGTLNLVNALSVHLVQMINDMVPNFRNEAMKLLNDCKRNLNCVPKAIDTDPASYMMSLIAEFCKTVDQYVCGGTETGSLIQEHRVAYSAFKSAIRSTAPNFKPYLSSGQKAYGLKNFEPSDDEEDGENEASDTESSASLSRPFYLQDMREHIEKSITRELPDNIPFQSKVSLIDAFQETWGIAAKECAEKVCSSLQTFLLESIKQTFGRYDNLQNHLHVILLELINYHYDQSIERIAEQLEIERTPYTQNTHYLESCKEKWTATYKEMRAQQGNTPKMESSAGQSLFISTTKLCFSTPHALSSRPKSTRVQQNLMKKRSPPSKCRRCAISFHAESLCRPMCNQMAFAPQSLPVPLTPMFSAVGGSSSAKKNEFPAAYPQRESSKADTVNGVLAGLVSLGYTGITEDDLAKLRPSDEYETELRVMAEVRGYFQVSYKRVIDNIPGILDFLFVKAVSKHLQSFLITKLGIGSTGASERLAMYVAEDPRIVAYREELLARKKRLEGVELELRNFGL
ncbi:P-loop containing nucleoside triphosphate hydrolase protein [Hygrophoropsis aurantiaca]|uniref:P-loop containing nucleoside triphosphate hydrolase protein n=1 Tax=Hygrophoropsis aurantiaca TaxID=72124 RepID=A0ACB8AIQ7_9AGAM|nr:P-loop containing nucleoside triphosphate hydrolase protein [Hygrophoropsis aurantiaca]